MSWYEEVFGEPLTRPSEFLNIEEGQSVVVEFLEDPRVVLVNVKIDDTIVKAKRAVVTVRHEGKEKALWLSRKVLARKLALLQVKLGRLKGVTVRITNKGKTEGGYYDYDVELIEVKEGGEG